VVSSWSEGTRLLVRTIDGGPRVLGRILKYLGEDFYLVKVVEYGHRQDGLELVVHQDDAVRDEAPG
jgi:hypothetical protein